jgi:two-component system alkaline phosphatase synthesis response regulator PhoP
MNEKILIVEDEAELCMTLGDRLRSEGYDVDFASDGLSGLEKATQSPFDLVILDIMLPFRSGLDVCTEMRRAGVQTPIVLLTARSQTIEKVVGLKLGADDYVTKPFDTFELMARIEALLRRNPNKTTTPSAVIPDSYRFGPIHLNVRRTEVTLDGKPVNLTAMEFRLLHYFAEHQGMTISREELLREVWGHSAGTYTRTVDMHVASLRQKLEPQPQKPGMIITIPGFGYRFQS